jgi:hypothetical protein
VAVEWLIVAVPVVDSAMVVEVWRADPWARPLVVFGMLDARDRRRMRMILPFLVHCRIAFASPDQREPRMLGISA